MSGPTHLERTATLEANHIADQATIRRLERTLAKMDAKLDDLVATRNRGAGVMWFITLPALIGAATGLWHWVRG